MGRKQGVPVTYFPHFITHQVLSHFFDESMILVRQYDPICFHIAR